MAKFLLVDDDPVFLEGLRGMVEEQFPNAEIEATTSGLEALRKAVSEEPPYDVMIVDVDMRPITGDDIDTIVQMLRHRKVLHTEVVLISGKISGRPGNYLHKPFSSDDLGALVGELLDRMQHADD